MSNKRFTQRRLGREFDSRRLSCVCFFQAFAPAILLRNGCDSVLDTSTRRGGGAEINAVFYIMVFFNHGTHATNHCVRARLGVRAKLPMAVGALVERNK